MIKHCKSIDDFYAGKRILVTGGTGTIGRRLIWELLKTKAAIITVFSRDETKQWNLRNEISDSRLYLTIGDIRDYRSVSQAVEREDLVFHCAAMKQVPACEAGPGEAALTNIIGAENLVRAIAAARKSIKAICCSTDKACQATGIMGMTKAIQEKIFKRAGQITCRMANVPGARGSVIPLWKESIARTGLIKITDPQMTRFMLPVQEAAIKLMEGLAYGRPGDIIIPAGMRSSSLDILSKVILSIYGGRGADIIGPRPGEKKHETIISQEESEYVDARLFDNLLVIGKNWKGRRPDGLAWELKSNDPGALIRNKKDLQSFLGSAGAI